MTLWFIWHCNKYNIIPYYATTNRIFSEEHQKSCDIWFFFCFKKALNWRCIGLLVNQFLTLETIFDSWFMCIFLPTLQHTQLETSTHPFALGSVSHPVGRSIKLWPLANILLLIFGFFSQHFGSGFHALERLFPYRLMGNKCGLKQQGLFVGKS